MNERVEHYLRLLEFYRESGEISETTYRNAKAWLTDPAYGEFQSQVIELLRPTPLIDAFYQLIPFGTGGRRGLVGVGANRMNVRTVGEGAQGMATYILREDKDGSLRKRGVVVAGDVRPSTVEFVRVTAEIFAGNGIKVFLFDGPRSTPLLSFAVRFLRTIAGAIVTASHNPPSDNGFKAYWEDGGQVVEPHDRRIMEEVDRVKEIKRLDLDAAKKRGLVEMLDDRVDRAYVAMAVKHYVVSAERDATIVYSPLHGTGVTFVPAALQAAGFAKVHMPPEQTKMDGGFPSVPKNYPNPEIPVVMDTAIALGKQVKADIVMASDPDADRLGVAAPDGKGGFVYLTGNVVGALLLDFILERRKEAGTLPRTAYALTTLVSTKLVRRIGEAYGVEVVDDLLVGFKNMAAEILRREQAGQDPRDMVFSFEESIGYMVSHDVRDKDSGAAALVGAQLAAWCKAHGLTILDRLEQLYRRYGYYRETQFSVFLEGEAGAERMDYLMDQLRQNPPREIAGRKVIAVVDRKAGARTLFATGAVEKFDKPKSNVLAFVLSANGETHVTIRPSGTEPKIKHYLAHAGQWSSRAEVDAVLTELERDTKRLENEILAK
jgi:phosphomannomutase